MKKPLKGKRVSFRLEPRLMADLGRYAAARTEHNLSSAARGLMIRGLLSSAAEPIQPREGRR